MRLETYKMATSILLKFQTLKCDISRTIWRIEVSDGSLFCIFHALSFEHNLFFDRTCPLRYNFTCKSRSWVWNDHDVIPIEPGNQLYYLIEKISNLLAGDKTLFLIDDIIADETLDKRCQPLLELAISVRHRGHSLWLLTAIPNNIRRQAKMLYIWYPKNRTDLNTIHEENDVTGPEELARVKAQLKWGKHTCLIMRMEHPKDYMIR